MLGDIFRDLPRFSVSIGGPESIPGLHFWFSGDFGITAAGANITSWADRSGNGYNATQTESGKYPQVVTWGQESAVLYSSRTQNFTLAPGAALLKGIQYHIFIVANVTNAAFVTNQYFYGQGTSGHGGLGIATGGALVTSGSAPGPDVSSLSGVDALYEYYSDGTSTYNQVIFPAAHAATAVISAAPLDLSNTAVLLNEWGNYGSNGVVGKVAEVVAYRGTHLTGNDKTKVESYLAAKWGLL